MRSISTCSWSFLALILSFAIRTVDKADATMAAVNEQRDVANEIAEIISNPIYGNQDLDEDELRDELADLEQEALDERLHGADHVPLHQPEISRADDSMSYAHSQVGSKVY